MAAMLYREPNMVKWIGERPGHNGTQVAKSTFANNATVILHTVTAAKTFFLTHYNYEFDPTATGQEGRLLVRNVADVIQYDIVYTAARSIDTDLVSGTFVQPLEIPAGYDICLVSSALNAPVRVFIHGWEE